MNAENARNEMEVARVIEEFKREKYTGKVQLDFKQGQLVGGRKEIAILK